MQVYGPFTIIYFTFEELIDSSSFYGTNYTKFLTMELLKPVWQF